MDELEEILTGLFTEIAIIEHLTRSRVANLNNADEPWQFGLLNYFVRNHQSPDTVSGIAWAFQDDEAVIAERVGIMATQGYLSVDPANDVGRDTIVDVTAAGRARRQEMLDKIAPDFRQLVSEIEPDRLATAHEVLREIRLTMDNLPDR